MARIISIHEYELREGTTLQMLIEAFRQAEAAGLFRLPGLERYSLLVGLKGARSGRAAAVWVYPSRQAWEALWGPPDRPFGPEAYPPNWRVWEEDFLAPLLQGDPDRILYTAYEEVAGQGAE